jgi:hypothetical protein
MMSRAFAMLAAAALTVPSAAAAPVGGAVTCGPLSRLAAGGKPQVGPLLFGFYTYPANTTGRAHSVFTAGYPTKVVLQLRPHRPIEQRLTLRGRSCATGKRLRFWYDREQPPFTRLPATTEELEQTGALTQVLRSDRKTGFHGYMLFTRPGKWKVTVWRATRRVGSVIVGVGT